MAEMLLINPRKRRARKTRRSNPSAAQLRARAKFAAMARARSGGRKRRRNPIGNPVRSIRRRVRSYSRRRRNPIGGLPTIATIIRAIKDAAIMGGGAIAIDIAYAKLEAMMPANLKRNPARLDIGDGIKAVATVAIGQLLSKPTRGLSMKAATGALVVQAHGIIRQLLPATMQVNGFDGASGLGYVTAAPVYDGQARVTPSMLEAYTGPFDSPLLNEYTPAFSDSPLLDGAEELDGAESEGYMR